ncbi:MAG TPA: erythromycin esterase family protein [Fulvivirga sp.]|nr:erythromycin esterase family protein [Fulvivirga sp.]
MKFAILLFVLTSYQLYSQNTGCLTFDNIDKIKTDTTLNQDFKNHKLVLLGEAPHIMPANTFFQSEFLIYLNKNFGTRNLLIEFGSSDAYLLNKYLQTGDSKYYDKSYYGMQHFMEAKAAYTKLYRYNLSLQQQNKIHVYGLDFEREPSLTAAVYYFLKENDTIPEMEELTKRVKARLDTVGYDYPDPLVKFLEQELPKYSKWLSKSPDWDTINELLQFKSSYSNFYERDKFMNERFLKLPKNERYLGSFGTMHTQLDRSDVFAGLLKEKPLVINLHHENSFENDGNPIKSSFLDDIGFFRKKETKEYLKYYDQLSGCEIFIAPVNLDFNSLRSKCDYIIMLKNQHGYTKE